MSTPGTKDLGNGLLEITDFGALAAHLKPSIDANKAVQVDDADEKRGEGWHGVMTCSACPVQIEGEVDGHAFYFRARGEHWSFSVSRDKIAESDAADQAVGGPYAYEIAGATDGAYSASWMPYSEAWKHIEQGIAEFRKRTP